MSTRKSRVVSQIKGPHLLVQELGNELVIFNRQTNTAHMLNPQAAAIYRAAADGCSMEEAARIVDRGNEVERDAAAALAVADLATAGVVTSGLPPVSRRSLLRTMGAAATAPMVISILAPTPAAAASNLPPQASCTVEDSCVQDAVCLRGTCCLVEFAFGCTSNADCCEPFECDQGIGPGPLPPGICKLAFQPN
jgi:hypothetical protein